MKAIPREAGRITYSTNIRKLKLLLLNDIQKAVVIGSILGDGNLSSNWSNTNRTISHSEFTEFYKLFYPLGKKVVPGNIKELIKNPMTIAIWFMDDGNIRKVKSKIYGYYLNTQSFSLDENRILIQALKNNFDISSMVMKNRGKCRIYVGAEGKDKFSNLIKDLVIDPMKYKIG